MLSIFPVDWACTDVEYLGEKRAEIHCWGKTLDGKSSLLRITFTPYFFVKTPGWSDSRQRLYIAEAVQKYKVLHSASIPVKRIPLLGFTNNTKAPFVQLAFETIETFRKARYGVMRENLATYEASLDPLLRFFHVRDIHPSSWVTVSSVTEVDADDPTRISKPHVDEYVTTFTAVTRDDAIATLPPLVIASWDLECVSEAGLFPDSSKPNDKIITIGTAFQRYGEEEPYLRSAITLDTCEKIEGVEVISCASEGDVVNEWLRLLEEQEVDVMVGYNTLGFDYKYLDGRHSILVDDAGEPEISMSMLGKAMHGGGLPIEKSLSSAAYGDNKYFYLSSPGIMTLDLLQIFRKELKLDSYSLNNVSKKYLKDGEEKIDLKPGEIFEKFTQGPKERAEIATYCVRDVELPLKLMRRLSTLENTMQMANAVCCPIHFLQNRGQQIRVYSQLIRKARSLGFVCPDIDRAQGDGPQEKYEGATVLNAQRGAYFDIISALDFASLYPSIIRAHTMCPSTLVLDPRYAHLDGIEYYEIETGAGTARFAQDVPCVVPVLLEELAAFRKLAKKDMAAATDPFQKSIFNAKQLAYKVSMNSVYGFFGATKGMLPLVILAAAVTATGRAMIEHSKKMAEQLVPGTEVVYGDSVAGYTPLLLKNGTEGVRYTTFDAFADTLTWTPRADGKDVALCPGEEVWSEQGWTSLQCLIRHRLGNKGMVRVLTHHGLVDCTTDHSLLTATGEPIKPSDVGVGTSLFHHPLPVFETQNMVASVAEARVMGFFFSNGSCAVERYLGGMKLRWMVMPQSPQVLFYVRRCSEAYPQFEWVTMMSKVGHKISPIPKGHGYSRLQDFIQGYHSMMYVNGHKVVPSSILGASFEVRQAFWDGLADGLGFADGETINWNIGLDRHISIATLVALGSSLGYEYGMHEMDIAGTTRLTFSKEKQDIDSSLVKAIEAAEYDRDYVYDCTTGNHHFAAGIGTMVVHNTDSIMCKFKVSEDKKYDMHEHFRVAQWVADEITKTFKHPVELEFEKTYWPYLLFSKKRYAGLMFTKPGAPDYIDVKGLQLVRRDNAPIVKDVSSEILDVIMHDRSTEKAVLAARKAILRVLLNEEPLEKFIISKALRSGYKNPDSLPHVAVAKKLKQRRGYPPASGERIPYVFVRDKDNPDGLQAQRAEDPDYVKETDGVELDTLYYVNNQLISPITTLLEVLIDDVPKELLDHPDIAPLIKELETQRTAEIRVAKRIRTNTNNKQREITSFFMKK